MTSALTVMAWIKPAIPGDAGTILSKYDTSANQANWALLLLTGGNLRFTVVQDGGALSPFFALDSAQPVMPADTFCHVAATFDAGAQRMVLYVNGAEVPAGPSSGSTNVTRVFPGNAPLRIGAMVALGGQLSEFFAGLVDEAALFDRALAAHEIAAIYAAGATGMCAPSARPRLAIERTASGILLSWPVPSVGWMLEFRTDLLTGGHPWTGIAPPYATNAAGLYFAEPMPVGTRFYRLHKP